MLLDLSMPGNATHVLILIGIFLKEYPNILGTDVAGEIYEVGGGVTNFKKGDRVLGYALILPHL